MSRRTPITIFVSSPGDVAAERRRCILVANRLNQEFSRSFEIRTVLWETEPMLAGGHFQDIIEPEPGDSDIVVVILWSRLGTPLPIRTQRREYRGMDGRAPVTGTEWEIENAIQAHRASNGQRPDLLVYRNLSEARAMGRDGQALRDAAAQLDALETFWDRHFRDANSGGYRLGFNTYTSSEGFEDQLESHLRTRLKARLRSLDPATGEGGRASVSWYQGSPFLGLRAFDFEHAPVFFGRWKARTEVIDALTYRADEGCPFLLILGASGIGKSSLVRAGVLPLLSTPGVYAGVSVWRRCLITPGAHGGGGDVFDILASALIRQPEALPEIPQTGFSVGRLAERMRAGTGMDLLEIALRQIAAREGPAGDSEGAVPVRLLLVVDQLEEIFADSKAFPEETIAAFAGLLRALAESGLVWVIATLRSDFYPRLAEVPTLLELSAGEGQYHLAPVSSGELDQIIRLPAQAVGVTFDEHPETRVGLDTVLREAAAGQDVLPLLEFALEELYRRDVEGRDLDTLTFESYKAMGGLEGAIAERAETAFRDLGNVRTAAVNGVLLALASLESAKGLGEAERARARTVATADLTRTPDRAAVVVALIEARLLVSDAGGDPAGGATLRLAHEALLRRWPRYASLLAWEHEFLKARGRVTAAMKAWLDQDKDPSRLLADGAALAEAEQMLRRRRDDLDRATAAFIEASVRAARAQRDQRLRRTRMATAAMAVLAVLSGVGAWFGFAGQWEAQRQAAEAERQRGIAETRKDIAESALRAATKASNTLVFELAQKFRNSSVPSAVIRSILEKAQGLQDTLAETFPDDPDLRRSQSVALIELGDMYLRQGSVDQAAAAYDQALRLTRELAAADPGNPRQMSDLAVSLERIGDIRVRNGDVREALLAYEDALSVSRDLVAMRADSDAARRDVSVSLNKVGDARLLIGDTTAALEAYTESLEIRQDLAAGAPDETSHQRDVSVSLSNIGDVRLTDGDTAGALAAYSESLDIARELAARDPANTLWRRDVSVILNKIGDTHLGGGDAAAALEAYREGLAVARDLADRDPDNAEWRHDVAVSLRRIGDALLRQGSVADALPSLDEAVSIHRTLAEQDPDNSPRRRAVRDDLARLGDARLQSGDTEGALDAYRERLDITQALADRDPANVQGQRDLIVAHVTLAQWQTEHGTEAEAREHLTTALGIAEALAAGGRLPASDTWMIEDLKTRLDILDGGGATLVTPIPSEEPSRAEEPEAPAVSPSSPSVPVPPPPPPVERTSAPNPAPVVSPPSEQVSRTTPMQPPSPARLAALIPYEHTIALLRADGADGPDAAEADRRRLSTLLGEYAYYLLFAQKFDRARRAAEEALSLMPDQRWIETNLAHANMFLGNLERADALYFGNRGLDLAGGAQDWEDEVRSDFASFREAGLNHPHMAQVEAAF
jgi:tetratricopeptide (TPR) repeat protein